MRCRSKAATEAKSLWHETQRFEGFVKGYTPSMKWLVAILTVLILASPVQAAVKPAPQGRSHSDPWTDPRFDKAASALAERPIKVLCYTKGESGDPDAWNAWGYTYLGGDQVYLNQQVCAGLKALVEHDVMGAPVDEALGAFILAHEASHLNNRYTHCQSATLDCGEEGRTNCRAIQKMRYSAWLLSGDAALAAELYHYALGIYKLMPQFPFNYQPRDCNLPSLP